MKLPVYLVNLVTSNKMKQKKHKIGLNVHTTNYWCIVTKDNKIIEKFRLSTAAFQMKSFYEKKFFQKLYVKKLKDLNQIEETKMFEEEFFE